jgi:hypothetical protein
MPRKKSWASRRLREGMKEKVAEVAISGGKIYTEA